MTDPLRTAAHVPATALSGSTVDSSPTGPGIGRAAGDSVPGYEIVGEVGRGGMGVVYKARHLALNRDVALKMVLGDVRADSKELARFLTEAEAAAAVDHPYVARVYEAGEADGRPYLALEYLPGGSLADRLKAGRLPPAEAAAVVRKVAAGVAAAHALGIVHRDLKPGNVLLDAGGEPKVTDFGLAKRGLGAGLTRTRAVMGTPAYMAPEQAAGRTKMVGPAADVYALGVILYEALAGRRPFVADTTDELLARVIAGDPDPLGPQVPGLPRDLELITAKSLAKAPADRYPTAAELAADLGRFLAGEPVSVRPAGPVERAVKWARRKPAAAAAWGLGTLTLVLLTGIVVVGAFLREVESARGEAVGARDQLKGEKKKVEEALGELAGQKQLLETALGREQTARTAAQVAEADAVAAREAVARLTYIRTIDLVHRSYQDGRIARARALLADCRPDLRNWEWRYLDRLCHAERYVIPAAGGGTLVAVSSDGTRILTGGRKAPFRVYDAATGALLASHPAGVDAYSLDYGPDGGSVLTVSPKGVQVWDAATFELRWTFPRGKEVISRAAFSPDGTRVAVAASHVLLLDAAGGKLLKTVKPTEAGGRELSPHALAFTPDGSRVACGEVETVALADLATGKTVARFRGHGIVYSVGVSPDGSRMVVGEDGGARVWDLATRAELRLLPAGPCLAKFVADGRVLTTGSEARLWDAATGAATAVFRGHPEGSLRADLSPDGRRLVTGGPDGVRVWDAAATDDPTPLDADFAGLGGTNVAVYSPDGARVLILGRNSILQACDAATGRRLWRKDHAGQPAFSPDGRRVAVSVEGDGRATRVVVYDAATGATVREFPVGERGRPTPGFTPDGERVYLHRANRDPRNAPPGRDGIVTGDLRTGRVSTILPDVRELEAVSADGRAILGLDKDWKPRVWDAETGEAGAPLAGFPDRDLMTSLHVDRRRVAAAVEAGVVVWDTRTGAVVRRIDIPEGRPTAIALSPDGTRLVTGQQGGVASRSRTDRVRVWDVASGQEVFSPAVGFTTPVAVRFTADGHRLLACGFGSGWPAKAYALRLDAAPPPEVAPPPRPVAAPGGRP